ncbi:MAG: histidine--tRNA ligase [Cytophagales bacterium]|nr:histidine--tRNA ligase [Cytophagales bacterium]
MKQKKPSVPKGTRDFGPVQMVKRNYIFDTIKTTFQKFGFMPLETPSMENLSTLTGKYGDEGDQLLFKILNSGDYLTHGERNNKQRVSQEDLDQGEKHLLKLISDKGLRYDLTVPFARHVVMNHSEIAFPFKRFQIQPVWRADKPQKGRYREFYQCDADVVGTDSLLCESEIVLMINEVLGNLNISDFAIKINNRKILSGIGEVINTPEGKETDLFVAVDKLDKIGVDKVLGELRGKEFPEDSLEKLRPLLSPEGGNAERMETMKTLLADSEIGLKGIEELEEVFDYVANFGLEDHHLDFDFTLARGLSYYTGAIFEVKVNNVSIGSISGGGRYDNLTGVFGLEGVSGVGFSFGVDRIYDVLEELNLFPENQNITTEVMFVNFDKESEKYCLSVLSKLRNAGIKSELYPTSAKMKKQMTYANKKNIPFVIMVGSNEIESGQLTLKDMNLGEQHSLTVEQIIEKLSN